jgi:hypothetical protein
MGVLLNFLSLLQLARAASFTIPTMLKRVTELSLYFHSAPLPHPQLIIQRPPQPQPQDLAIVYHTLAKLALFFIANERLAFAIR